MGFSRETMVRNRQNILETQYHWQLTKYTITLQQNVLERNVFHIKNQTIMGIVNQEIIKNLCDILLIFPWWPTHIIFICEMINAKTMILPITIS